MRARGNDTATKCCEHGCPIAPSVQCGQPLRGSLEGKTCGRPVCRDHVAIIDGKPLCPAHANWDRR